MPQKTLLQMQKVLNLSYDDLNPKTIRFILRKKVAECLKKQSPYEMACAFHEVFNPQQPEQPTAFFRRS